MINTAPQLDYSDPVFVVEAHRDGAPMVIRHHQTLSSHKRLVPSNPAAMPHPWSSTSGPAEVPSAAEKVERAHG